MALFPSARSFPSSLKLSEEKINDLLALLRQCKQKKDPLHAKGVLAYLREQHLESHRTLGSYIVAMLVECGCLSEAQRVFDILPHRNGHAWSSLIMGYTDHGDPHHSFHLYHAMQEDRVGPSSYTYVALLKACTKLKDHTWGRKFHSHIIHHGLECHPYVGSIMVDLYGKCGSLVEASHVFNRLPVRDAVSWNALITSLVEYGPDDHTGTLDLFNCTEAQQVFEPQQVFHLYHRMQADFLQPTCSTFVALLKACTKLNDAHTDQGMHSEIVKKGFERDIFIGNTLVDMYGKLGALLEARQVLDKLPVRDVISWNALIAGYNEQGLGYEALGCFEEMQLESISPVDVTFASILKACSSLGAMERGWPICAQVVKKGLERDLFIGSAIVDMFAKCGLLVEAQKVFNQLPVRNLVSWTALIAEYAEHGHGEEALGCFERMQRENIAPGPVAFACSLKACGITGSTETGKTIHTEIVKRGFEGDLSVSNTLIDMYGKCGLLAEGIYVFDKLTVKDVVSWTAMIQVYGENHEGSMAVQCFEATQEQGVKPNAVTFTCLLAACSHASLVVQGQEIFSLMKKHEIEPTLDHYACIVDLLARSGRVYEAVKFMEAMQGHPSKEGLLSALLSACKIHGEVEVGLKCFQQIIQLNRQDAAPYLMIADIYATDGRWSDAYRIEEMRKHVGAKKKPACAAIEVTQKLHEFVVGNNQNGEILAALGTLTSRVMCEGLVPNLELVLTLSGGDEGSPIEQFEENLLMLNVS